MMVEVPVLVFVLHELLVRLGVTAIIIDHIGEGIDRRIEGVAHGTRRLSSVST